MAYRLTTRRIGVALSGVALVAVAITALARQSNAVQGAAKVRGNVPGEWRYWGADAWSTRYSALDQINASNFGSLEVAWQWNASSLGADEYYRTTPLYANGRIFTVATTRRVAAAIDPESGETLWMWRLDEGIRWQKAPRQFAGRGLAYWQDGNDRARHCRDARLSPGCARCQDWQARSEVRQGRRCRPDGRTWISAGAACCR